MSDLGFWFWFSLILWNLGASVTFRLLDYANRNKRPPPRLAYPVIWLFWPLVAFAIMIGIRIRPGFRFRFKV